MQTHTMDVVLWFVPNVTEKLLAHGATVCAGIHASLPENSVRICTARMPLAPLLANSDGVRGKYAWHFPLGGGEEEEIGFVAVGSRFDDGDGAVGGDGVGGGEGVQEAASPARSERSARSDIKSPVRGGASPRPSPARAQPAEVIRTPKPISVKVAVHSAASLVVDSADAEVRLGEGGRSSIPGWGFDDDIYNGRNLNYNASGRSATSAMRKPQTYKRVRNDEA
jgi:hypothetical protein